MRSKGFTLLELLISISILAIISSIGFISYSQAQLTARDSRRKLDLRSVETSLEIYRQKNSGSYPLTNNWSSLGTQLVPNYINKLPNDPSSPNTNYSYSSDGSTYSLCANLENNNDKDRILPGSCPTDPNADFVITP